MSCCKRKEEFELYFDNHCAEDDDNCKKCSVDETPYCLCRSVGGYPNPTNCNTARPPPTVTINLEPCQCAEEIEWNCYTPPKPSCKWLNNFCELRRQWSNHARQQNCKCCNCKPRINMTHSVMNILNIDNAIRSASHTCKCKYNNGMKKEMTYYCSFIYYIGSIGYTSLVPGPLAMVSFILLILLTIGLSSSLTIYKHLYFKTCLKHCD